MSEIKFNGDKLFQIRRDKKISQGKLAAKIGVSRQTIYLWETNQSLPDVEKVSRLCKALEVNLSELVNGVEIDNNKEKITKNFDLKDKHKHITKIIIRIIIISMIVYFIIFNIKFIKLNKILYKWKKLDKTQSYYIEIQEFVINKSDYNTVLENLFSEKYYSNNVLKLVLKDSKNESIDAIQVFDYNKNQKMIIDENKKTYYEEKIENNADDYRLGVNNMNGIKYDYNVLKNYFRCLNPTFNIYNYKNYYEINANNAIKKYVNRDTGLIEYEEFLDSTYNQVRKYYKYELNTSKDYKIDLSKYTEVSQLN